MLYCMDHSDGSISYESLLTNYYYKKKLIKEMGNVFSIKYSELKSEHEKLKTELEKYRQIQKPENQHEIEKIIDKYENELKLTKNEQTKKILKHGLNILSNIKK